jgi:hypothetical protein
VLADVLHRIGFRKESMMMFVLEDQSVYFTISTVEHLHLSFFEDCEIQELGNRSMGIISAPLQLIL